MLKTLLAVTVALQAVANPVGPIPVDREPQHRIAYADGALRVLQVNLPVGYTTLDHEHSHDLLTVNVENGPTRTRDGAGDWGAVRERAVGAVNVTEYTGRAASHVVRVVGEKAYRLTGVENVRATGWSTLPPIQDSAMAVMMESRAFRAYSLQLPNGASTTHIHAVPVVVVLLDGAVEVGSTALAERGAFAVVPAGQSHAVRAQRDVRAVEVEVR